MEYGKYTVNEEGHEYIDYNGYYLWLQPDGAIYHKFDKVPPIYVKKNTTEYSHLMQLFINRRVAV